MTIILTQDDVTAFRPLVGAILETRTALAAVGGRLATIDQALNAERIRLVEAKGKIKTLKSVMVDQMAQLNALLSGKASAPIDIDEALLVKDHNQRVGVEMDAINHNIELLTQERQQEEARVEERKRTLTDHLRNIEDQFVQQVADTLEQRAKADLLAVADGPLKLLGQLSRQQGSGALKGWRGADWLNTLQGCWPDPESRRRVGGHGYRYPFERREEVPDIVGAAMAEVAQSLAREG